jgi:hypothetical protein
VLLLRDSKSGKNRQAMLSKRKWRDAFDILDRSPYFIDNTPISTLLVTFSVAFVFLFFQILSSLTAPKFISSNSEYFNVSEFDSRSTLDFDITLYDLEDVHRFFEISAILIRRAPPKSPLVRELNYSCRPVFFKNYTATNVVLFERGTINVHFKSRTSDPFCLLQKEVVDYDTAQVRISLTADFRKLDGCELRWTIADPSFVDYSHFLKGCLSVLHIYMLANYLLWLKFGEISLVELLCVILGSSGMISCNPRTIRKDPSSSANFSDHVLFAGYVAMFRMFCLLQLDMIRSRRRSLDWRSVLAAAMFYALFGYVEASADFDHMQAIYESRTEIQVKLPITKMGLAFFLLHVGVSTFWIIVAVANCLPHSRRRLVMIILALVAETVATCFGHFFWAQSHKFSYSLVPETMQVTVQMTLGAFVLFLMHPEGGDRSLDQKAYTHGTDMLLDEELDEATSDEDDYVHDK